MDPERRDGSLDVLPSRSPRSERAGPYRLLHPIARGGMSETFVAERTGAAGIVQRVCLKRLRSAEANDPAWIRRFLAEARISAALSHQNIVSLFDVGQDESGWWMAFQLVEGVDLRGILSALRARGEPMPVEQALLVTMEVGKALAYAHARLDAAGMPLGLVHRDVSPGNILVSVDGGVYLTDFGIAKVTHAERTRTGEIIGKAPYMSPEHALGEELDARADVFSLGVVLFEMLTGEQPFHGATPYAVMMAAVGGKRGRVEELRPGLPAEVVRIVDGMLRVRREERLGVGEVLEALSAAEMRVRGALGRRAGATGRAPA